MRLYTFRPLREVRQSFSSLGSAQSKRLCIVGAIVRRSRKRCRSESDVWLSLTTAKRKPTAPTRWFRTQITIRRYERVILCWNGRIAVIQTGSFILIHVRPRFRCWRARDSTRSYEPNKIGAANSAPRLQFCGFGVFHSSRCSRRGAHGHCG
jgi:hypothetical protein